MAPTRSPSIVPAKSGIDSIAVEELASPRVNSPPSSVRIRDPSDNDGPVDIVGVGTQTLSIRNLKRFCSRIGLKSTEILTHVLPIGESTQQSKWNNLWSHKACCCVDNDSVKYNISTAYVASMCCFQVKLDWCEESEHRHAVVVWIHVGISL